MFFIAPGVIRMKTPKGKIEWKIEEENGPQTISPTPLPEATPPAVPAGQRQEILLALLIAAVLLLLLGGWLWQRPSASQKIAGIAHSTPLPTQPARNGPAQNLKIAHFIFLYQPI